MRIYLFRPMRGYEKCVGKKMKTFTSVPTTWIREGMKAAATAADGTLTTRITADYAPRKAPGDRTSHNQPNHPQPGRTQKNMKKLLKNLRLLALTALNHPPRCDGGPNWHGR